VCEYDSPLYSILSSLLSCGRPSSSLHEYAGSFVAQGEERVTSNACLDGLIKGTVNLAPIGCCNHTVVVLYRHPQRLWHCARGGCVGAEAVEEDEAVNGAGWKKNGEKESKGGAHGVSHETEPVPCKAITHEGVERP